MECWKEHFSKLPDHEGPKRKLETIKEIDQFETLQENHNDEGYNMTAEISLAEV